VSQTARDRRHYPRVVVAIPVELDVFRQNRVISCRSVNVSAGGARVRSPVGLDAGQTVLAALTLAGQVVTTFADVLESLIFEDSGATEARLQFWYMSPRRTNGLVALLETVAK